MVFIRQTWTLCKKTLTIVLLRHWLGTVIRAFFAPVIFMFFISYAKNFFVPPSDFGVGNPSPLRSLSDALGAATGGRDAVAFVNSGHTGGAISHVIREVSQPFQAHGMSVHVLESDDDLLTICTSSVRGVSPCFAAISFHSSPNEGPSGQWNYSMRLDGAFGARIYVDSRSNDAQIYALPLQHAVDSAIGSLKGLNLPDNIHQYPYTDQTPEQRTKMINHDYMGSLIKILAVAYFVGICGICYQLTGEMAKEREMGMSQLIEAMMPNRRRWMPQAARLLSIHIAFDMLYFPSWIIMSITVARLNYPLSSTGVLIGYFILSGLALSSWSIGFASLFRKAQLSGITVVMVSIILAIIVQVIPPSSTATATILSLLFAPMNFVLFIIYMAYWQQQNQAVNLMQGPPTAPWQMPGYLFFVFCAIQIVAYPVIGALIERSLYGTASKARQLRYDESEVQETVKIRDLSKHYRPNWWQRKVSPFFTKTPMPTVFAVNEVNISVLRGQIMVLLGANGSGKSTTLDMMAGLQVPTNGSIEMDATGGIGLCPQQNVLWAELTVYEHVQIFNRLKARQIDPKATIKQLIADCDMTQKTNATARTLSGGQKRKCQLAMMLTGGSKLCMLDEVSSGLDPLSRRKIWDILLAERGRRSILLTTHFLDEADLLSDDIAILSKGKLVANGSAVELKHRLGGGYRARIYHETEKPLPAELEDTPKQVLYDQTVYQLEDSAAAARFVAELEKAGVRDYQINGPTIEDVFLSLAEEVRDELERDATAVDRSSGEEAHEKAAGVVSGERPAGKGLQLVTGKSLSFLGQTWVLFRKRATILRRNAWPYVAALLLPIITAGLVTLFITDFAALSCNPKAQVSIATIEGLDFVLALNANIPAGPPRDIPQTLIQDLYPLLQEPVHPIQDVAGLDSYIASNYSFTMPGGFILGDSPTFAWRGNYDLSFAIATQNLMDVSLLDTPIAVQFQAFDYPWAPSAGKSLQFVLYFGLAMSAFPGFFALYTTIERLRNVRALHYSNGVRAAPLWIAYTLFDFTIVVLASAVAIIIFTAVSDVFYAPGYLFVIFVFYGLSATLMAYTVSLVTSSQLATFAFAAGGQCSMFLLYFIAFICIVTYAPVAQIDNYENIAAYTIGLFFPSANLLRALLLSFNEFSLLCRGNKLASYPGAFSVYGSPIFYLIMQSVILLTVIIWSDSGWKPGFLARTRHRMEDAEETDDVDSEVFAEAKRVETSNDDLRLLHVGKAFGSNIAVQDVSFGVPKGEVFSLLGPNGAGKSTTIGLIRGDMRPSDRYSEILIEGTSILKHRAAARTNLGVCAQFDAIDQMTAIEHLRFYARARGVSDIEHNVDQVLHAVGLDAFKSRMAAKLSGGNKRKLSLGIALMGNPSVLLLDEPSSGMDAASKRIMWRTLSSVSAGRSLVLTTHSMEEADALADRAGILSRRMLALGTADQLRKKHGDAYHVHLVHKDAPYTTDADMDRIKDFIHRGLPGATTEERVFHGQLRFSVPNDRTDPNYSYQPKVDEKEHDRIEGSSGVTPGSGISALFAQLEANKHELGFEYYSVSQATLDQVFLSIVTKHNVLEENYAKEHQRKEGFGTKVKAAFGKESWGGVLCGF